MKKITLEKIERKLKTEQVKCNKYRSEDLQVKLENALGVRWFRKLKVFKASNVTFDPILMHAVSYGWWTFLTVIKGKVVFNAYRYSNSTSRHQSRVKHLLRELGIKVDVKVNMSNSLSAKSFKTDSLVRIYTDLIELEIAIARKGSNKESNKYRVKTIKRLKQDIKVLRALGAKFSKQQEKAMRKELLQVEVERLECLKLEREASKVMKYVIQDWAGNICFFGKEFDSFDDADEFLTLEIEKRYPDTVDDDARFAEERGEYYLEQKPN